MLSVESMAQMLGGVLGSLALPWLVTETGFTTGWAVCAAALLLAALLTLTVRDRRHPAAAPSPDHTAEALTATTP